MMCYAGNCVKYWLIFVLRVLAFCFDIIHLVWKLFSQQVNDAVQLVMFWCHTLTGVTQQRQYKLQRILLAH